MYTYTNGRILAQHDGGHTADRNFYLHDRLGSVRQVIDTSGDVKNRYIYQPFGELYPAPDFEETVDNSFKFAGQYFDSELDEYYMRARQYDPHIYRFTARDPVFGKFKEPLTLHAYLYCLNDPVNHTDPIGRFGWPTWAKLQAKASAVATGAWGFAQRVIQQINQCTLIRNVMIRGGEIWSRGNIKLAQMYNALFGSGISGRAARQGSRAFSANQKALVELAKNAKRTGVTREEAKILLQWAKEYGVNYRGPEIHPGRAVVDFWHIVIGPYTHIKIID